MQLSGEIDMEIVLKIIYKKYWVQKSHIECSFAVIERCFSNLYINSILSFQTKKIQPPTEKLFYFPFEVLPRMVIVC